MADHRFMTLEPLRQDSLPVLLELFRSHPWAGASLSHLIGFDLDLGQLTRVTFDDPDFETGMLVGAFVGGRLLGAGMGVRRPWKQGRANEGWIKFLWAEPGEHFLRAARSILETLEAELGNRGVGKITFGSSSPSYLLPGVPIEESELLEVLLEADWRVCGERLNLTLQISPENVGSIESNLTDAATRVCTLSSAGPSDRARIDRFIARHFSESWRREVQPVFEDRSEAFLSVAWGRDGEVVGFAATSATNPCWLGPMGVAPSWRRRGIGRLLVLDSIRRAAHRGMKRLLLPWINTENHRFYARVCGAELHQRFWKVEKVLL